MFRMEIETGGAAFKDPETGGEDKAFEGIEISRIMRKVAAELREGKESGSIMVSTEIKLDIGQGRMKNKCQIM